MKLFYIYQEEQGGYDTYDSAVVAAEDSNAAVRMPADYEYHFYNEDGILCAKYNGQPEQWPTWATNVKNVNVREIGEAVPGTLAGVILASFNAG